MRRPSTALLIAPALLLSACIVEAPGGASPNERRQAVVTQVPPLTVNNGAIFEEKVELVGATVQPGRISAGDAVRVTAYFKVLKPVEEDLMVFVHAEDPDGRVERLNADHKPAGGLYPTTQWKVGETVKDEFTVALPSGTPVRMLNLWVGFWEPGMDKRLQLKNPGAVRNDGHGRVLLVQVPGEQP